jgi:hypothetical protein
LFPLISSGENERESHQTSLLIFTYYELVCGKPLQQFDLAKKLEKSKPIQFKHSRLHKQGQIMLMVRSDFKQSKVGFKFLELIFN